MINKTLTLFFFTLLFAQNPLFKLGKETLFSYNFFETIPYSEWSILDTTKQRMAKNSFLEKELVYFESNSLGQHLFGENYIKLKDREDQLLINFSYETLVAFPLIKKQDFVFAEQNILKKYFVHHILLGYNGCSMPGDFSASKEEALNKAAQIKKEIISSFNNSPDSLFVSVFQDFASLESQDPSVSQNKGSLGWVSWGRTVASFQSAVFNLKPGLVSDPVLTDFGYHLIFVEKEAPSDFSYYNPSFLENITKKACLQSLDFENLRGAAISFDSSLVSSEKLVVNKPVLENLFSIIENNTKEKKLRGNKNSYINWIEEQSLSDVLFIYNNNAFGVGWFVYYLEKMPATRVPSIKKKEDLLSLLKSFILQDAVLSAAREQKLETSPYFQNELLKHKKNILQKEFSSFLVNSIKKPDSSAVSSLYNKGVFRGEYVKPKSVVYSEIKTSSEDEINKAYNHFLSSKNFDETLKLFGGSVKSPVSQGSGGPLSLAAFDLNVGEVSAPIENRNKTFSLIRVEKFILEEPFSLDLVYNQIERKIIKEKQDSVKFNLLKNLKNKHSIKGFNL